MKMEYSSCQVGVVSSGSSPSLQHLAYIVFLKESLYQKLFIFLSDSVSKHQHGLLKVIDN